MAQSFQAVSTALGEAERIMGNRPWNASDYQRHYKRGYEIDESHTADNEVLVSAHGKTERELVNEQMEPDMIRENKVYKEGIRKWNKAHRGHMNPKTGKPYRMKSFDKRRLFPVGEDASKGTRLTAYDIFLDRITKGNIKGKHNGRRMRSGVLQQYIVGFGNQDDWSKGVHKTIMDNLYRKGKDNVIDLMKEKWVQPYLERFQKENPNLHIVQAVIQVDETHPHLHFTVFPHMEDGSPLGSVGYQKILLHDHPEIQDEPDMFLKFYNEQHDTIRDIVVNTPFFDGTGWKVNGQPIGPNNPVSTSLGVAAKRDSNNPNDVNEYNNKKRLEAQLAGEYQNLAKESHNLKQKNLELDTTIESNKKDIADDILTTDPHHKVAPDMVAELPEEISTQTGYLQHTDQSLEELRRIYRNVIQIRLQRLRAREDKVKENELKNQKRLEALKAEKANHTKEINAIKKQLNQKGITNQNRIKSLANSLASSANHKVTEMSNTVQNVQNSATSTVNSALSQVSLTQHSALATISKAEISLQSDARMAFASLTADMVQQNQSLVNEGVQSNNQLSRELKSKIATNDKLASNYQSLNAQLSANLSSVADKASAVASQSAHVQKQSSMTDSYAKALNSIEDIVNAQKVSIASKESAVQYQTQQNQKYQSLVMRFGDSIASVTASKFPSTMNSIYRNFQTFAPTSNQNVKMSAVRSAAVAFNHDLKNTKSSNDKGPDLEI